MRSPEEQAVSTAIVFLMREVVYRDVLAFLRSPDAPPPSGAEPVLPHLQEADRHKGKQP